MSDYGGQHDHVMPLFDGPATEPVAERDERLGEQLKKVRAAMLDGEWKTLRQLADECGCPESSASARLRDLRKPKFGEHVVERRHLGGGLYEYRVRLHLDDDDMRTVINTDDPPTQYVKHLLNCKACHKRALALREGAPDAT